MRIQKRREDKVMGRNTIKWWKNICIQRQSSELELPSAAERIVKIDEIGDAEVDRAMKKNESGDA